MIRGRKRPLVRSAEVIEPEAEHIDAKLDCALHNRFDLEVVDTISGEIKQRAQAENSICDTLWTKLFTPASYFNYIHYGTGSGTPASTDTGLFTFLNYGTPSYIDDLVGFREGTFWYQRKIQLSETAIVGATLTEVGIAYGTASNTLVTHAMLRDMNGNPVSITKTATDVINIYATVFVHWSTSDPNVQILSYAGISYSNDGMYNGGLFPLAGKLYNWGYGTEAAMPTAAQMTPNNGSVVATTSGGGGTIKAVTTTYNASNKTITLKAARFAVAESNVSHALGVLLGCGWYDSKIYNPFLFLKVGGSWYPGTNITGEAIGTGNGSAVDFKTAFPMVSGATVYVDGVAQMSGVTVDQNFPFIADTVAGIESVRIVDGIAIPKGHRNPTKTSIETYSGDNIFYNTMYDTLGIASFSPWPSVGTFYCSNDLNTWVSLTMVGSTVTVPAEYRNYRYWKIVQGSTYTVTVARTRTSDNNIHFTTPPASGAVITADYTSKTIAKDVNHVFDLTVTLTLAEKAV